VFSGFSEDKNETYTVILTGYDSCQKCCSWHYNEKGQPVFNLRPNVVKTIGQTASGKMAKEGRTIAMPKEFPFGTRFRWKGKTYVCEDRGGAIKKNGNVIKIDVYFDSHKKALEFGVKRLKSVKVKR